MNVNQTVLGSFSPKDIGSKDPFDWRFASGQCAAFHLAGFGFGQRVPRSALLTFVLLLCLCCTPAWALRYSERPGERIRIESVLEKDKSNLIFFHAAWSKTSSRYLAQLQTWSKSHPGTSVYVVNVLNLNSPVAKQFKLKKVPAFRVYDGTGTLTHSGQDAHNEVVEMLGD